MVEDKWITGDMREYVVESLVPNYVVNQTIAHLNVDMKENQ